MQLKFKTTKHWKCEVCATLTEVLHHYLNFIDVLKIWKQSVFRAFPENAVVYGKRIVGTFKCWSIFNVTFDVVQLS